MMQKFSLRALPIVLVAVVFFYQCSKKSVDNDENLDGAPITLDATSTVASTFTLTGESGEILTIVQGTKILKLDDGVHTPLSATNSVRLSFGQTPQRNSQTDSTLITSFVINAVVDGAAAALAFFSSGAQTSSSMPNTGATVTISYSGTSVMKGTQVSLYKLDISGAKNLVGSLVVDVPVKVLGRGIGSGNVSPDGTGAYNVMRNPPLVSSPGTIPGNAYWATYSNIPDTMYTIGSDTFGGPLFVGYLEIGEPSTRELLTALGFPPTANCVTTTNANDGAQYWAERTQDGNGKTTQLKIASTAANVCYINFTLYSQKNGLPILIVNGMMSEEGGVHAPDGSLLTDPYSDAERPIAGQKQLNFNADFTQGREIRGKVEGAGYEISSMRFENYIYTFDAIKELDGRAKIEEDVLEEEDWKTIEGQSKGNIGFYEISYSFTGKIVISWQYLSAFTISIDDAKLERIDDGPDETNYTLSGTAKISPTFFTLGDNYYILTESASKPFTTKYGFKVRKDPSPAVRWSYAESWDFACNGSPLGIVVNYMTATAMTVPYDVPIPDLKTLDGTFNMSFMMPSYGGTATWEFKKD